jgi:hypothetical protein
MRNALGRFLAAAIFIGFAVSINLRQAAAADLGLVSSGPIGNCSEIVFTCENGRQYPLCPIAVSVFGESGNSIIVHSSIQSDSCSADTNGVGYRYAGPGIWLDGYRENALLNFGTHSQVACTIQHD